MMLFLKCLVEGLRHFMVLRNGGPPGPERSRGEQGGGRLVRLWRTSPVRNALKPGTRPEGVGTERSEEMTRPRALVLMKKHHHAMFKPCSPRSKSGDREL